MKRENPEDSGLWCDGKLGHYWSKQIVNLNSLVALDKKKKKLFTTFWFLLSPSRVTKYFCFSALNSYMQSYKECSQVRMTQNIYVHSLCRTLSHNYIVLPEEQTTLFLFTHTQWLKQDLIGQLNPKTPFPYLVPSSSAHNLFPWNATALLEIELKQFFMSLALSHL